MRVLSESELFLRLFRDQARILATSSELLLGGVRDGADRYASVAVRIEQLEKEADGVVRRIVAELNQTVLPPFDAEVVHSLASALDDILDALEEAAYRIGVYGVWPTPTPLLQLCEILDESAKSVQEAIGRLGGRCGISRVCLAIDRLESEADIVMRQAVETLVASSADVITVVKLKEIYEFLEDSIDRCEDVADALRNVLIKRG